MSLKSLERAITNELRDKVGNKVKWVEWTTSENTIKKNLQKGEKMIYLPIAAVWVAYKEK